MINTPMMNDDTTRIVPWSYQGITSTNTINKDTKFQLYYIHKIRSNTSDTYKKQSASGEIGDSGISMLSLHYSGIDKLEFQSYYYYVPELYSTFMAQVDYSYILSENILICPGIQYFKSGSGGKYNNTNNKNGGDDIDLIALRLSLDTEKFTTSINYSRNFGRSGIVKGYGGLAKVFTTSMIANGRGNYMPQTWMLKTSYKLPLSHDSEVAFRFTDTKFHDKSGNDFNAYYFHFKHHFNPKTSIYLRYEDLNYDNDTSDTAYFRAIASYEF